MLLYLYMKKYTILIIISLIIIIWEFSFAQSFHSIASIWGCHQDPMASFISTCLVWWEGIAGCISIIGIILSTRYFVLLKLNQNKN